MSPAGSDLTTVGVVKMSASRRFGVWQSALAPRIRAGEAFTFETATYTIRGTITRLAVLPPRTGDREARP